MEIDNKITDNFLIKSSFVGLLALYYSKLMYDSRKAFDKKIFSEIRSGEYCYSYFIASTAFGYIESTTNGDIINITNFDSYLSQRIKLSLKDKADKYDKSNPTLKWNDDIIRMENLSRGIFSSQL